MGSWVFIGSWVIRESWVLSGSWVPFFRYAFNRKLNKDIFYEENDWSNKTSNEIKFFGTSHRVFYDDFRRLLLVKNEKLPIKLRTFLLTTRKKKLLKKSVAGSYYNQDDWLEKYAEGRLYKWSSDESSDNNLDISSEKSDFENNPETETRHQSSFTVISTDVLQKMR